MRAPHPPGSQVGSTTSPGIAPADTAAAVSPRLPTHALMCRLQQPTNIHHDKNSMHNKTLRLGLLACSLPSRFVRGS